MAKKLPVLLAGPSKPCMAIPLVAQEGIEVYLDSIGDGRVWVHIAVNNNARLTDPEAPIVHMDRMREDRGIKATPLRELPADTYHIAVLLRDTAFPRKEVGDL